MIDLTWREIRQVFVEEDTLYSALLYVYRTYIGTEDDSIDEIIEGIQDNIENYIEELADLFDTYEIVPENVNYSSYVINWLNTNLKDFVEDFLTVLYPMMDINEKVDYCNITNLLDNEEFIKEFKLYLGD